MESLIAFGPARASQDGALFFSILRRITLRRDPQATSPTVEDVVSALRFFHWRRGHLRAFQYPASRHLAMQYIRSNPIREADLTQLLEHPVPDHLRLSISGDARSVVAHLLAVEPPLQLRHTDAYARWRAARLFDVLYRAAKAIAGQEALAKPIASDLALQLADEQRPGSVRCLLHGKAAWGSTALAQAIAQALEQHAGYTALEIDCSAYRSEGESASWDGAKSYWAGSGPGEITKFIYQNPKAVIVFHRIDETLPSIMATLRDALRAGKMVDGYGLEQPKLRNLGSDRRHSNGPTPVNTRDAVFIFTAEHGSEWLTHSQADTILGSTGSAQRQANMLHELVTATRNYRGEKVRKFDASVLKALAQHHHVLTPAPWETLHAHAVQQWPLVQRQVQRQLGQRLHIPSPDDLSDIVSLLLLSHGADVTPSHAQSEALYRNAFHALQVQRLAEAPSASSVNTELRIGLTPQARAQWAQIQQQLGPEPVQALQRQKAFLRLWFTTQHEAPPDAGTTPRAGDAWLVAQVALEPVRTLADYTGASGLVSRIPDTRFDDVCGHDEVKRHMRSVIAQLKTHQQLARFGIEPPRGVVLHGPPGTGKTMLARAVAGEAQLPFISVSATELLEPNTLRRVYDVAHRNEPCVIHIDEADALGRRGQQSPAHDAALNFLLTKIDGFEQHVHIFHVLTTNRPDELDEALTRPGRIERKFLVGPLDRSARQQHLAKLWPLLRVPRKQMRQAQRQLIAQTYGMTGAELQHFHAEVVRHALGARLGADTEPGQELPVPKVTLDIALSVLSRLRFGDVNTVSQADETYRRRVAEHEAGHALAHHLLLPQIPLAQVTIAPRGRVAGSVIGGADHMPVLDETPSLIRSYLTVLLAGRAAEIMLYGPDGPSSGATQDLIQATEAARKAVAVSGLDEELGSLSLPGLGTVVSERLLEQVEERVRHWVAASALEALRLLHQHQHMHEAIVKALLDRETLYGDEIAHLIARADSSPDGTSALTAAPTPLTPNLLEKLP
ncbi:MAG: AAA family ATPase [Comamonadaceae bacterium]|nr:AAA family ATPase [Comamonadaceae bacterium]